MYENEAILATADQIILNIYPELGEVSGKDYGPTDTAISCGSSLAPSSPRFWIKHDFTIIFESRFSFLERLCL